ncbi:flagellar biosynthetic protein FliQ [Falsigemmobacter intermedius]|uniref:Flagellar biosynthetic protein FliQ n=1 Tax=Falsigemmobacter intermedius TaxID=1553448 RepID=A0A3S3Y7L5_9RHOB|nr:flagellar biosynthetic protein FliQ [Falsigemmobacter intermedius]RWY38776.1 flagellar biosynthetic protein FliQ [Falsigemmobacter intermedius]
MLSEAALFDLLRQSLWIAVQMSAPLLTVALIAGLAVGLFQALTSVQEMTLTFVPKLALILVTFWATMSFMTSLLRDFFATALVPLIAGG